MDSRSILLGFYAFYVDFTRFLKTEKADIFKDTLGSAHDLLACGAVAAEGEAVFRFADRDNIGTEPFTRIFLRR